MTAKPKHTRFTRATHEQFALEAVDSAKRELVSTFDCSTGSVYATVRMNRDIGRARAHLGSIGHHDSPRTQKLWSAVEKVQRQVDLASNRMAKCVLRCAPGDLLGRAGARRRRKR
jgi:hypothetical protein